MSRSIATRLGAVAHERLGTISGLTGRVSSRTCKAGGVSFGLPLFAKAIQSRTSARGRSLKARQVTVHGMSNEYADAHNAEDRSNSFQHGEDPKAQRLRPNGMRRCTVKRIPFEAELRERVMISCNMLSRTGCDQTQAQKGRPREPPFRSRCSLNPAGIPVSVQAAVSLAGLYAA
jgi:hypothetical protein